jgi:hypothetical protein
LEADPLQDGRDELNLASYPLALVTKEFVGDVDELLFVQNAVNPKTGAGCVRRLRIESHPKYGLPTQKDEEVLLGLINVTKIKNGFTDPVVRFGPGELRKLMGWSDQAWSYARIEESVERWWRINLDFDKAWYDKVEDCWTDQKFHVLSNVEFRRDPVTDRLIAYEITWDKVIFRSLRSGFLGLINLATYYGLKSPIAKRIYRYLSATRKEGSYVVDLRDFAFEKVGMSKGCQRDAGQIKQKLATAFAELERIGFLVSSPPSDRYARRRDGGWDLRLTIAASDTLAAPPSPPGPGERPSSAEPSPLAARLIGLGVNPKKAEELVASYPEERILEQVGVVEDKVKKKFKFTAGPGGWLVKAIEQGWTPPLPLVAAAAAHETRDREERARLDTKRERASRQEHERRVDETIAAMDEEEKRRIWAAVREEHPEVFEKTGAAAMRKLRKVQAETLFREHVERRL